MTVSQLVVCTTALGLLSAASAMADPAYVTSNVNLRTAAGTSNPIMDKIPAGSLVDTANCSEWCEVSWQGKRGFVIATSLDRSGRVPMRRAAAPPPTGAVAAAGEYTVVPPPVVVAPGPYYYGRPYYWGYGPRWGYGRRWRYY